jgi:hypothetical protein
MKQEIWFKRIFIINFMPCHWKGWVVTAVAFVCSAIGVMLAQSAHGFSSLLLVLFFLSYWIWFMVMAIRHS